MGYRYQVNFEKQFTAGPLKGMWYSKNYLRFCDWQSANAFAESCDGKTEITECVGSGAYIKHYPILVAIE